MGHTGFTWGAAAPADAAPVGAAYRGFAVECPAPQPEDAEALPIYLDYNATTPIDPRVAKAMLPYICRHWGNPSSSHIYGRAAKQGVDNARKKVALAVGAGAKPSQILFTSGGSESANHAIRGAVALKRRELAQLSAASTKPHVITSCIEHPCVLEVCKHLAEKEHACELTILPVDSLGRVSPNDLNNALRPETAIVTIMHANNETGTVQPIRELVDVVRAASPSINALFHTDASQTLGKIDVNVTTLMLTSLPSLRTSFTHPRA